MAADIVLEALIRQLVDWLSQGGQPYEPVRAESGLLARSDVV